MIKLRDYQLDLIQSTRESLAVNNSVVMQLATGGGKTFTTAFILDSAIKKGRRCIFCVHRIELLRQTSVAFDKVGIEHGYIAATEDYDASKLVHIASIDTLRNRLDDIKVPDFIVIDEAHRAMCDSWQKVINYYPTAKKLLITATPERLDGRGLKHVAQDIVLGKQTRWLIDNGFLSKYRVFAPSKPDLTNVKTTAGDYNNAQLAAAMTGGGLTGDALEHYRKHADGKQAIVFAVNIEHSKSIVAQFNEAGIASAHIDGTTPSLEREDIVERFRYGETKVLSNVNILTEGFDLPNVEVAILLRPTKSLSMFLQMVGRALRPIYADGADLETTEGRIAGQIKKAIILDHAGNCIEHGLPAMEREWSLEGKKGRAKPKIINTTCEDCFHVWERRGNEKIVCPVCGWTPPVEEKKAIEAMGGDLNEVDETAQAWAWAAHKPLAQVMKKVTSYNDLVQIARVRGYKAGYAYYKAKELGLMR